MRDPNFDGSGQGQFAAWAVAVVFLAMVAAPALLSHSSARAPGLVDVGTPGITVTAVPPSAAVSEEGSALDWVDRETTERENADAGPPVTAVPAM
jgi:hypothetical protein